MQALSDASKDSATTSAPLPHNASTTLFNGMIAPLMRWRIKGVIWYQGESDALENRAVQYRKLFPALIQDWRGHWGYGFPFLFVQLPEYLPEPGGPMPVGDSWVELQKAQAGALSLPNTAMASTIDLGPQNLHPINKQDFARRLALAARRLVYGEPAPY